MSAWLYPVVPPVEWRMAVLPTRPLELSFISDRATTAGWSATSRTSPSIFSARNITRSQAAERIPSANTLQNAKILVYRFLLRHFAYLANYRKFLLSILASLKDTSKTRALGEEFP